MRESRTYAPSILAVVVALLSAAAPISSISV
jgi:hypothetical protein